ncbi:MAG: site-specific DNA-methyltransferase, partial [Acidobacteria bacterium]|nr:site-specific DNA-methyltransferase [Acidobacteriota bacterium]
MTLPFGNGREAGNGLGVTFRDSKRLPVHGWYPYVEGFSAQYVTDALLRFDSRPKNIYDPFGGAGTAQVAASHVGLPSFYAEINPFMRFVAETKVSSAAWAQQHLLVWEKAAGKYLEEVAPQRLRKAARSVDLAGYHAAFPNRDFFEEQHLRELLAAVRLAEEIAGRRQHVKNLLLLACAANTVKSSHMTRRADLRRRRPDEYKTRMVDVSQFISSTVSSYLQDIRTLSTPLGSSAYISSDARSIPDSVAESIDLAITSPPYLNGTNYFRNTKLELWLLGFISSESDLGPFRQQAICAGINNVSAVRGEPRFFPFVEKVASKLDEVAYDQRIPKMVRHYCSDMHAVLQQTYRALRPGGHFLLDIGDSCFCGVHVPTDNFITSLAQDVGFECIAKNLLAERYSKDSTQLTQVELVFRKPTSMNCRRNPAATGLREKIRQFGASLPYKEPPYTKRNWGHPLHSLCSYQGKLKPAIAHWLVNIFVPQGGSVLDPLGGVGTIPFEASSSGRFAVSVDKNRFAATVASAKLRPPRLEDACRSITELGNLIAETRTSDEDYAAAEFGLNARVVDYYHPDTLAEVLKARKLFLSRSDWPDDMIFLWASLLHILHGNRPYALSRTSHPITPLNPSGAFEYRPLLGRLKQRVETA